MYTTNIRKEPYSSGKTFTAIIADTIFSYPPPPTSRPVLTHLNIQKEALFMGFKESTQSGRKARGIRSCRCLCGSWCPCLHVLLLPEFFFCYLLSVFVYFLSFLRFEFRAWRPSVCLSDLSICNCDRTE